MLGLVLIYFIGKYFYKLAEDFGKSKWGFAILGVVSYYAGAFLGGIILGLISIFWEDFDIEYMSDMQLGLMAILWSVNVCWSIFSFKENLDKKPRGRRSCFYRRYWKVLIGYFTYKLNTIEA